MSGGCLPNLRLGVTTGSLGRKAGPLNKHGQIRRLLEGNVRAMTSRKEDALSSKSKVRAAIVQGDQGQVRLAG